VGPDGLHSRHWLRRGRHRPIGKRCLQPHLPSSSVCCVLADISARVYTSRGERSSEKSRLTCLAQVEGHLDTPPPRRIQRRATRLHARAQYVIVHNVIPTITRRGHPCAIPPTYLVCTTLVLFRKLTVQVNFSFFSILLYFLI